MTTTYCTDGGSRGNGQRAEVISGCGVYNQSAKKGYYYYLGDHTNNFAEYMGILKALQINTSKNVIIKSDSKLAVQQINGLWKINNIELAKILSQIRTYIKKLDSFKMNHVKREFNTIADKLANKAMDEKKDGTI